MNNKLKYLTSYYLVNDFALHCISIYFVIDTNY